MPTVRSLHSALNPAIKSLNYLNNILAKIEANNSGCEEAIMLNAQGFVSECTGDNIFMVTPPLSAGALYGITRRVVMELGAEMGMPVHERNLTRHEFYNADECFLTGTGAELVPVVKIDGRVIGNGTPGPATIELVERYHTLTKASVDIRIAFYAVLHLQRQGSHGAFDPDHRGQDAEGGPVRGMRQDQGR